SSRRLLSQLDLRYINKLLSSVKLKGVQGSKVFLTVFLYRFLDFANIYQLMQHGISLELGHQKDVLYSFLKNPKIDWRRIMYLFLQQVTNLIAKHTDGSEKGKNRYLIVDDTMIEKSGKKIELIGKVFDHSAHAYNLGMKVLSLGLWEGKNFLPVDFSIHNEAGKNKKRGLKDKDLKQQYTKHRSAEDASYGRVLEVSSDKIDNAIQMIKRAVSKRIYADYVLADTWFICDKFIRAILSINKIRMAVIGLMKTNRKISISGKQYMANTIPDIKQKDIQSNKKLKCRYITFVIDYKGIQMRAYWICMKGQSDWKMLISTDTKLSFQRAMEHYQVRWSIEVFFKDCKQHLSLNNCQSTDMDAHIATISIVFMNYMILTVAKRFSEYETLGGLFENIKELIVEDVLIERLWKIFIDLYLLAFSSLGVDWELFMSRIIEQHDNLIDNALKHLDFLFSLKQQAA
ncbi:MAG: transposase, partial [Flavobacteriales bacterium]|nr:transposase [Flavobacteriales bacterium]